MRLPRSTLCLLLATLGGLVVVPAASALASEGETTSAIATPQPVTIPTAETPNAAPKAEAAPGRTTPEPAPSAGAEPVPQVAGAHPQHTTGGGHRSSPRAAAKEAEAPRPGTTEVGQTRAKHKALAPGTLTPALPFALQGGVGGVPNLFIEDFQVPPFLLPIFQAAGAAYDIPWQVLAAINEVETDYGRDLSVSSAGAEGWMQFLPSSWSGYGIDANGDGYKDPYNPADAIFAAARYLAPPVAARTSEGRSTPTTTPRPTSAR